MRYAGHPDIDPIGDDANAEADTMRSVRLTNRIWARGGPFQRQKENRCNQ